MTRNSFAIKLQHLLHITNTKNATLAKAVRYDLSYISKWLNGKMLPSEKNVDEVIKNIVSCIQSSDTSKLLEEYQCSEDEIGKKLLVNLHEVYNQCKSRTFSDYIQDVQSITDIVQLIDKKLIHAKSIVAVLDILSLPHESRLVLAGIKTCGETSPRNKVWRMEK